MNCQKKERAEVILAKLLLQLIEGKISFFEGASKILAIRNQLNGVLGNDEDFNVFLVICSETDHIPSKEIRGLLAGEVLAEYERELEKTETWARSFAEPACRRLMERYGSGERRP